MAVTLRGLRPGDLGALREALDGACTWLDLPAILAEKLEDGAAGPARVTVATPWVGAPPCGLAVTCGDRLRLLAVARPLRGRGMGSALLDGAERSIAATGAERISVGDEAGNYVSPGIEVSDGDTLGFFERRGYRRRSEAESLIVELQGNPRVGRARAEAMARRCAADGYRIERLEGEGLAALLEHVRVRHGDAWAAEVRRAARGPVPGVWVARSSGELCGFAVQGGNNRGLGGFGPAATTERHRGRGLGAALLLACLADLEDAGHRRATISWIGPRAFYDRVAGVAGDLRFSILDRVLAPRS